MIIVMVGDQGSETKEPPVNHGGMMSILSKFFSSNGDNSDNWGLISTQIAQGFEKIQKNWFRNCIDILQQASDDEDLGERHIVVKHTELAGDASLAVKAFQLMLASEYIAKHTYISRSHGQDFANILYAQVCGTDLLDCMKFFKRYVEVEGSVKLSRFSSDLACYITDKENSLDESILIAMVFPVFAYLTHMVVADAFGDQNTVILMQAEMDNFMDNS